MSESIVGIQAPFGGATPSSSSSGSTAGNALVFRPGGSASGNVYTSWSSLVTAAAAISGPKIIYFDTTGATGTTCHIPTGTWDLGYDAYFVGDPSQQLNGNGITFDIGAVLSRVPQSFTDLYITLNNTAAVCGVTSSTYVAVTLTNTIIVATANTPLVSVSGAGSLYVNYYNQSTTSGGFCFQAAAGGITAVCGAASGPLANSLKSTGGGTISLFDIDPSSQSVTTQSPTGTKTSFALFTQMFGTNPVAKGGTNSSAALNNNRLMVSSGSAVVEASAITANSSIRANAAGYPVTGSATDDGSTWTMGANAVFSKAITVMPIQANVTSTYTPDASLGSYWRLQLTSATNLTLANPTNMTDGQRLFFELVQPPSGTACALALGNIYSFGTTLPAATVVTNNTVAKRDFIGCIYNGTAVKLYVLAYLTGY